MLPSMGGDAGDAIGEALDGSSRRLVQKASDKRRRLTFTQGTLLAYRIPRCGRCWVRTSDPLLVREVLYP